MDAAKPVLWSRSLLVMIVLFVVTLGLYPPIWFLRRRAALNALDSPVKLSAWPFVSLLVFGALAFVVIVVATGLSHEARSGLAGLLRIGHTR